MKPSQFACATVFEITFWLSFWARFNMAGNGPTGQFANLATKLKHEIPMAVLLPTGGPVRRTISGTDCDGIREVDGITAIYEVKALEAKAPSKGQMKALRSLGDFFIGSRWLYQDLKKDAPAKSADEQVAIDNGYKANATPVSAVVWAKHPKARGWLRRYLEDCGFNASEEPTGGYRFQFEDPWEKQKTHIFRPTRQWLHMAYLPDYYAEFSLRGNYSYAEDLPF